MSSEHRYLREWLNIELEALFQSSSDREAVANWLSAHRGRPKVVLIGSGFSRNARLVAGQVGNVDERVPLWPEVSQLLRQGLGYFDTASGPSDPLLVAEQYQESRGYSKFSEVLLDAVRDSEIEPGPAHQALGGLNLEAIITTNQLDTLLDHLPGEWFSVVDNTDLAVARSRSSQTPASAARQLIYLHGHRSAPRGWVFSRSEYERIYETKPALVRRVQQLLCEYPLLILGYSLSDPDFHWLFSTMHREQGMFMPRALCVTVGNSPGDPERAHWRQMGMHLAHLKPADAPPDISRQLAALLHLDVRMPSPDDVAKWLCNLEGRNLDETVELRLNTFEEMARELNDLEESYTEFTRKLFDVWRSCLPTFPPPGAQSAEHDERLEAESWQNLPEAIQSTARGKHSRALARACDLYLQRGGGRVQLAKWLSVGVRWRVRNRPRAELGDRFKETFAFLVGELCPLLGMEHDSRRPDGLMQLACAAAWRVDWMESSRLYGVAAEAFERHGDHVGAYWASLSRTIALRALVMSGLKTGPDEPDTAQEEEVRTMRLRLTPAVARELDRRSHVIRAGLNEAMAQALSQAHAFRYTVRLSTGEPELRSVVDEDARCGVFPGIVKANFGILLQCASDPDSEKWWNVGLQYGLKDMGNALSRQVNPTLDAQLERDEALSRWLVAQVGALEKRTASDAQNRASLVELIPNICHRLTIDAVTKLLDWVVKEAIEPREAHAYVTAFGQTPMDDCALAISTLLSVVPQSAVEKLLPWLGDLAHALPKNPRLEFRFWHECARRGWDNVVALGHVSIDGLLAWHLNAVPQSAKDPLGSKEEWFSSLQRLVQAAFDLGCEVSSEVMQRVREQASHLKANSLEWFEFQELLDPSMASLECMVAVASEWPAPDRVHLARKLAEAVQTGETELSPAFRDVIENDLTSLAAMNRPGLRRLASTSFGAAATCMALGVGDTEVLSSKILEEVRSDHHARLEDLAPSIVRDRWSGLDPPLLTSLLNLPVHPIRDLHLVWLFYNLLALEPERFWGELTLVQTGLVVGKAISCTQSDETQVASMGARTLVQMLSKLPDGAAYLDPLRAELVSTVRRCAFHPNSVVRSTVAYLLARWSQLIDRNSLESTVAALERDHCAKVASDLQKGRAAGRVAGLEKPTLAEAPEC